MPAPGTHKEEVIIINKNHRAFADNLIKQQLAQGSFDKAKAYRATYPNASPATAAVKSVELVKKDNVVSYIASQMIATGMAEPDQVKQFVTSNSTAIATSEDSDGRTKVMAMGLLVKIFGLETTKNINVNVDTPPEAVTALLDLAFNS